MGEAGKILVIRLSSIGDIILTTPLLRSLRESYPRAHITFLIKKQFAELLLDSPYINELLTIDKADGFRGLRKIKQQLKARHFNICLDIHNNWRSRYIRLGLGTEITTTYPKYILRRTLLVRFKLNLYKYIKPVYLRYFDSVRKFGLIYDGKGTEIHVPLTTVGRVKEMISCSGIKPGIPLVIICPGATYLNKQWKKEGFIETARYLIRERSVAVIIHGGKDDINICRQIAEATGMGALSMAGKLSLSESAALLSFSSLVIANDSGLLHLAQSQKRPVVGIYGSTTRELGFFPMEPDSTVVQVSLSCRPCTPKGLNYCPRIHFRCMNDITASQVIRAALPYLNKEVSGIMDSE